MNSFDSKWEYTYRNSDGNHLNRYPYGQLVTYFFRNLKHININKNTKILELGCGVGNNLPLILNEGIAGYGIDGSETVIEYAKERLKEYKNCELKVMDFLDIDYDDSFFDMVIDRQSIYANLPKNIKKIYSEVNRIMKKDGIFLSFMYNTNDYHFKKLTYNSSYAEEIDTNTYTNFKGGTFEGNGTAHFFSKNEIEQLCERYNFEILLLVENSIEQIIPTSQNMLSEYILVARKC